MRKLLLISCLALLTAGCGILYKQPIYQGNLLEKTMSHCKADGKGSSSTNPNERRTSSRQFLGSLPGVQASRAGRRAPMRKVR
ncbi:MAG TPA: hypothetical protein VJ484_14065, partial [Lysobacter sp.]|nr:hypothetical protein [Lysobacter sp.]